MTSGVTVYGVRDSKLTLRWVERVGQQTSLSLTARFVAAGVFTSSCLLPPERLGLAEQGDGGGVADVTLDDAQRRGLD